MFITGQQVVCINGDFEEGIFQFYIAFPKEGEVYVVRGMAPANDIKGDPDIAVYLEGIRNPNSRVTPHRERGFRADRFRALEEMTEEEILAISKRELVPVAKPLEVHEPISSVS